MLTKEQIRNILSQIYKVILGLGVCCLSLVLLASLVSFDSLDPSFNTISDPKRKITNFGGVFGSYTSDLLLQLIGLSAFLVPPILFFIGFVHISSVRKDHKPRSIFLKVAVTPLFLVSLSSFLASFPIPSWWKFTSLGGINGAFLLSQTSGGFWFGMMFLLFSSLFASIIFEISYKDWIYFFRYSAIIAKIILSYIWSWILKGIKKIINRKPKDAQDPSPIKQVFIKKPTALKQPVKKASLDKTNYQIPSTTLLVFRPADNKERKLNQSHVETQSKLLIKVLEDFGVRGTHLQASLGPVVTLHEFEPEPGTKASRVIGLADDIARSMSAVSARIATVPGKTTMGIELPNQKREMIYLRELLESDEYKSSTASLPIVLGKNIASEPIIADLAKMPHLLIAGTTGSGKSVGLNVMILSIIFKLRPDECKLIMIDPKMLELSVYDGIPHLLAPVVTDPAKAIVALKWVVREMEERYRVMSSINVRNILGYNEKVEKANLTGQKLTRKVQTGYTETGEPIIEQIESEPKKLPFIIVVVDEMADLMLVAGKEIENSVQRLAQMARAAGIHIIMATQRPSVDVITGVIKANFPTRISFQVTSRIDSRTILGTQGAEQLLGQGDMIYMSGGNKMTRVHGPFCSDSEIEEVVSFIKNQDLSEFATESKITFEIDDPEGSESFDSSQDSGSGGGDLYAKAVSIVRRDKKASISYVQRQLRIGYNRAADLIERMEREGIITEPSVSGKREVIE